MAGEVRATESPPTTLTAEAQQCRGAFPGVAPLGEERAGPLVDIREEDAEIGGHSRHPEPGIANPDTVWAMR